MPGHVRQNDTDFTLLQEELNAPILGHCGLILQLAQLGQLWVPTAPKRWGQRGESDGGTIELIVVYWPALTWIGYPSKLGSY